jgi:hypothetical protein
MPTKEWGGLTYGVTGNAEVKATVGRLATQSPRLAAAALHDEAILVLQDARRLTPIGSPAERDRHVGQLRESGAVDDPVTDDDGLVVAIHFGGPGIPYAIRQHQGHYTHPQGGEREYLVDAIDKAKRGLGQRLADRIAAAMGLR